MKTILIALRNVRRGGTRSAVTIGAMAFAGAVMVFYAALLDGALLSMERNAVDTLIGDIQIHAQGYREDPDLYKRINNVETIIDALNEKSLNATPRLYGFGLGATKENSSGISLIGIDTALEKNTTSLPTLISKGEWLSDEEPMGVVVGRRLARSLDLDIGAELVVLSQSSDGGMANEIYYVRGVAKTVGGMVDSAGVLMPINSLRELLYLPDGAHQIVVSRKDKNTLLLDEADLIVKKIAPSLEVKTWRKIAPVVAQMIDTSNASLVFLLLIAYTAIGMVTLNTMLMSVFERIKEFGVMKAIGASPIWIMTLVFTEALWQALIACLIAAAAGISLTLYYADKGIDLSNLTKGNAPSIGGVAFDPIWRPELTANSIEAPLVTLVFVALVAVIYPGVKAALIKPVEATQHI